MSTDIIGVNVKPLPLNELVNALRIPLTIHTPKIQIILDSTKPLDYYFPMDKMLMIIVGAMGKIDVTEDQGTTILTHTPKGDVKKDDRFLTNITYKGTIVRYYPILHSYLSVNSEDIVRAIYNLYEGKH